MAKSLVRYGPWSDGLQVASPPEVVSDRSFVDNNNFELGAKGELKVRRGFRVASTSLNPTNVCYYNAISMSDVIYAVYSGVVGGVQRLYLVTSQVSGPDIIDVTYTFTHNFTGNTITSVIYYQNVLWVICSTGNSFYSPAMATPVVGVAFTAINTGPDAGTKLLGSSAVVLKDRLFVISSQVDSTVYFSSPYDFTNWNDSEGAGVFKVGAGDGRPIYQLAIQYDNLYIFKSTVTYMLSYNVSPTLDGAVTSVSRDQGAAHVAAAGSTMYVVNGRGIYMFLNNIFYDVAQEVELELDTSSRLVALEDQLLVSTLNGVYAMNLQTRKWSIFSKVHTQFMYQQPRNVWPPGFGLPGDYKVPVVNPNSGIQYLYWRYSGAFTDQKPAVADTYYWPEVLCKSYDFGDSSAYKRFHYCTLEGAYEGPNAAWRILITDEIAPSPSMQEALFPSIAIATKASYPVDRARAVQTRILIKPHFSEVGAPSLGTYYGGYLTSFGYMVGMGDVQSGTED